MIAIMAEANNAGDHSLLWGYPLEFWDRIGLVSLVAGAIVGVVALLLTAASAYILYRVADTAQIELASETKRGSERLAELTVQAEQLRKDTAEAQAKTKQAEVDLEQLRKLSERRTLINRDGFIEALKGKPKEPTEIWYLREAPDARWLADSFASALLEAGWGFTPTKPIPDLDPSSDEYLRGGTNVTAAGGQATGITVAGRGGKSAAAEALSRAISIGTEFIVGGTYGAVPVPHGALRIVIGNKIDPIFWPKGVPKPSAEPPK